MKVLALILLFVTYNALAFPLKHVSFTCENKVTCPQIESRLEKLKGDYNSLTHLAEVIKIYAVTENFDFFKYSLSENEQNELKLHITISPKPQIKSFKIEVSGGDLVLPITLPTKEDDYFDKSKLEETQDLLKRQALTTGYTQVDIKKDISQSLSGVEIKINVILDKPRLLRTINIDTNNVFIKNVINNRVSKYLNRPFDLQEFRLQVDNVKNYLFEMGYYITELDVVNIQKQENDIKLNIHVSPGQLIVFDVVGDNVYEKIYFKSILKDYIRINRRPPRADVIKALILDYYKKVGFLNAKVNVVMSEYKNKNNEEIAAYRVSSEAGTRFKMKNLIFMGSNAFKEKHLKNFFYSEASDLVTQKYFDREYFDSFPEILKKHYITAGFVTAQVEQPQYKFNTEEATFEIEYKIKEGVKAKIEAIEINVGSKLRKLILEKWSNVEGKHFDPVLFEQDLFNTMTLLGERGYYYGTIKNKELPSLLTYSSDFSKLRIILDIEKGPKLRLGKVIIAGNWKTKNKYILKNVHIPPKGLVRPVALKNIQNRLTSTGLFSSVKVEPIRSSIDNGVVDVLVQVVEKDFGIMELAPGYRTDIGLKLTGTITYNNIAGVNRTLSLRGQVNQRLNYTTIDKKRREQKKNMTEYAATVNLTERYFADTDINYAASISASRKRFYSFDADIARVSNTFSRDLATNITGTIRHQYENIAQFNASQERDDAEFRIGAFTPSLTWDLRDNRILTRKGAFLNLSCEYANPLFLSQKNDDLEINFYKLVSRNRFYVPYPNGKGVLALSLTYGVEQNLANGIKRDSSGQAVVDDQGNRQTKGYIPNIKVFRLAGNDIVRGYDETEINRLVTGQDISKATVDEKAYLLNLKVEPRFFLTDSIIMGAFYDAGRVFVDKVENDELRSSVGLSFKYLTPVGSLDFDYGIKTLRKRDENGTLESPGRLHVSIGFF